MRSLQPLLVLPVVAGFLFQQGVNAPRSPFGPQCRAEEKKPGRWEKEIEAFEKKDRDKPPPANAVLFVGSSSIRIWNLAKSFPGVEAINRGFGGSHIADSVQLAPRLVIKYRPRLIVFYAGDNDIASGKSPQMVAADFKAFVQTVHKDLPKTKIVFIAIKPSPSRWKLFDKQRKTNGLIEAFCKEEKDLVYLDVVKPMLDRDGKPRPELFGKDGLHLNEEGYKLWTSLVQPLLK